MTETHSPSAIVNIAGSLCAVFLCAAGVYGYYFLEDQLAAIRIATVLIAVAAAVGVFLPTAGGHKVRAFVQGARVELRKVVWPKRQEALQATAVVFVAVVLVGLFLWAVDSTLFRVVRAILAWGA